MRKRTAALALIGAGAAAVEAARRVDRKHIESDPEWKLLRDRPRGRAQWVTAPDGAQLHVETFGPDGAPTIVLAHGWTCAIRFWVRQLHELPGEFRVVAFDQRGHGRSPAPESRDFSIHVLADDLHAVLEATLTPEQPAVLVGHSMGAMAAVAYADRHREAGLRHLAAVMMVNTGMGDLIDESLVLRMPGPLGKSRKMIGRVLMGAAAPLPPIPNPVSLRAIGAITCGPNATLAEQAFCERMVLKCGPEVRAGFGRAMSRMELHEAIAHLDVPSVVLAGRKDRLTPLPLAKRLADTLPQLIGLHEIDTGHMGPIEAPDEVNRLIRELARSQLRQHAAV